MNSSLLVFDQRSVTLLEEFGLRIREGEER